MKNYSIRLDPTKTRDSAEATSVVARNLLMLPCTFQRRVYS